MAKKETSKLGAGRVGRDSKTNEGRTIKFAHEPLFSTPRGLTTQCRTEKG